ncbi:MAG TPA: hypothetical protein VK930_15555, partial [Verrucomicrobiae bacterium]|nr:hypothetical protein [Verrucomicrobiae bacterium]
MSSPFLHQGQQKPQGTEWAARLIPGAACAGVRKKPQREVRARGGARNVLIVGAGGLGQRIA